MTDIEKAVVEFTRELEAAVLGLLVGQPAVDTVSPEGVDALLAAVRGCAKRMYPEGFKVRLGPPLTPEQEARRECRTIEILEPGCFWSAEGWDWTDGVEITVEARK